MGIKRVPFLQSGLSCFNSKCLQAQSLITYATPTLGSIVVKGKFPIDTGASVAAEKNVDFPTLVLPSNPICMLD
jgi:hypothetical protein